MVTVVSYGLPVQSKEKDPFVKGIMEVAAAGLVSVSLIVMQQRHSNASVSQVDALQWTFKMKLAQRTKSILGPYQQVAMEGNILQTAEKLKADAETEKARANALEVEVKGLKANSDSERTRADVLENKVQTLEDMVRNLLANLGDKS